MRTCLLTVAILLLGAAGVAHAGTLSRVDADTLLRCAVEIRVERQPGLLARCEITAGQRMD